ncbi:MAG: hypothetical protein AAF266_00570 [Planctomycetota bacterium]
MTPHARRTAVLIALLGSMAYGLGAAPCGCWEHSGWRAALALLSDERHHPEDAELRVEDTCEDHAVSQAVLVERPRFELPATVPLGLDTKAGESTAWPDAIASAASERAAETVAQPVRAALQVFRL